MPKSRNETPAQREARLDAFERDAMPIRRKSTRQPQQEHASMSHVCIRFYIGHESKTASAEAIALAITNLRERCATVWGGSTAIEGEGLFQGSAGLYRECCTIVEAVADVGPTDPPAGARIVRGHVRAAALRFARDCARLAGQECVMVTVQPLEVDFVTS